jgi:chromosome segregation protein
VRQRDVALLFADAATGAHSPALVSQGRIAAVIAAKPQQRREMLEEAAGIAGLHVRRREAEIRLRATEANLEKIDEMLGEMEVRGNALRRQARAAERYRTLSTEIGLAEARALFGRWREAAAAAEQARSKAALAEQAVAQAGEAQRAAAAYVGGATTALAEARAAADVAREQAGAARHKLETLRAEDERVERRLEELSRAVAMLARDRAREDALAIDAAAALKALDEEDKALGVAIARATAEQAGNDAGLALAERKVRDAEVAVAQALAAAAAEEAEARVAEAALAAARQRAARADAEAQRVAREVAALGDVAPLAAAYEQAKAQVVATETQATAASAAIGAAEAAREQAALAREETETRSGLATAALARAESEAKALSAGLSRDAGNRALTKLTVAAGYERALAAALGDDLDAPIGGEGARAWAGAAVQAGDPALPEGVAALAGFVTGGEALERRLAQIGVVESDAGWPLAVGQRIVTLGGRLRRWDGYVARDVGAAAAERLVRANRLREIEAGLPALRDEASAARTALDGATTMQRTAREQADAARRALATAEEQVRAARRREDQAQAAAERHAASFAALQGRKERTDGELAEAQQIVATAQADVAALPDRAVSRAALAQLNAAADLVRAELATARGRAAALGESIARDQRRREAAKSEAKGWRARAGDAAKRIEEMAKRLASAEAEHAGLAPRPDELAQEIATASETATAADAAARAARESESGCERELRRVEAAASAAAEALANAREARATLTAHAEHQETRRGELSRAAGDRFQCPAATLPEKIGFDAATLGPAEEEGARHDRLVADRERLGPVNLVADTELAELDATRETNAAEREELGQAVNRLRGSIGSLNREGRQRLLAAFEAVDGHFRRLFGTLFGGGEAHLALIDSDDPLEAGLEIMAQPPGKRLGSLTLLSGGEQALTAVALIFALFLTNPAPICVLDEVDAPLDDANIERFCDLLVAMTKETDTRYLVVTHNAVTMSRMHRLFGVTMIERGISRLVSVDLGGANQLLAAE